MDLDKEILDGFKAESLELLGELENLVSAMEDAEDADFPEAKLKEFSQKIDRIMGSAKTLLTMAPGHQGLTFLANVSEMCKSMGYQAAALRKEILVPIFAGFWAETVEIMQAVLQKLESDGEIKNLIESQSTQLQKRLAWLAEKVSPGNEQEKAKVVAMLKKL